MKLNINILLFFSDIIILIQIYNNENNYINRAAFVRYLNRKFLYKLPISCDIIVSC